MAPTHKAGGWDRGYRRILGGIAAISLTIAAVIGLFTVLFQANLWGTEKILITVALLGLSSALGLACEWARSARTAILHQAVMVIGLVASLLGWVLLMPSIWSWWPSYVSPGRDIARFVEQSATISYFCAAAIAYDGVFHLMGFRGAAVWVRRIGCVGAYAVALTLAPRSSRITRPTMRSASSSPARSSPAPRSSSRPCSAPCSRPCG